MLATVFHQRVICQSLLKRICAKALKNTKVKLEDYDSASENALVFHFLCQSRMIDCIAFHETTLYRVSKPVRRCNSK